MTDHLEELIAKEASRQGKRMNADSLRQAAVDLAGAVLTDAGLIHLPNVGTISAVDYVRSLRAQMPDGFSNLEAQPATNPANNLTAAYRAELAATRRKQSMPAAFNTVRSRYSADSLTGRMMDEIAATRR